MKVLIVTGGYGKRLQPLTNYLPKHLLPVAGKPILEYILLELAKRKLNEITICLGYRGNKIKEVIGDGGKYNVTVSYFYAPTKIGNWGTVVYFLKKCFNLTTDDLLVWMGDELAFIDLNQLLENKEKDSLIVSSMHSKENVNRGIVEMDEGTFPHRILHFREKVESRNKYVVLGIYLLTKGFIRKYFKSLNNLLKMHGILTETIFFPKLLKYDVIKGVKLRGTAININTPYDYLLANKLLLNQFQNSIIETQTAEGVKVKPPSIIETACVIGKGTSIGPLVYIGAFSKIGEKCSIRNSIILNDTYVGDKIKMKNCITGSHSIIKNEGRYMNEIIVSDNLRKRFTTTTHTAVYG